MPSRQFADGNALIAGWGVKQGHSRFKTWNRRYFVLRTIPADGTSRGPYTHVLLYYKSSEHAASGAAPKGTVLLTRGETRVSEVTRKVGGKEGPCLLVSTPGQRDLYFAPYDARRAAWIKMLTNCGISMTESASSADAPAAPAEWPLLEAVLKRSAARAHADKADASAAAAAARPAPLASSWPPEDEGPPLLESTVRAVVGEAAALRATRPDDPGVRRAVEAADRAEASVSAAASGVGSLVGADAAEPGRDVAAAIMSLQGVDWEGRVEKATGKIDAQGVEFEKQLRHLRKHGTLPTEVRKEALEQLLDAVGALAATAQVILPQAEAEAKRQKWLSPGTVKWIGAELRKLPLAVEAVRRWRLQVPRLLLNVGESELRSMPLAATDPGAVDGAQGGPTVQRVIGALVFAGGAAALKHVAWVDFAGDEPMFPKTTIRGGQRLPTISRPSPEALGAPACANLAMALRVYGERATAATAALVPKVLDDVTAYVEAKTEAMSHPSAEAALAELDALCEQVPQPPCDPPNRHVVWNSLKQAMMLVKQSDADAPSPTALEHAVHKQQRAVAGSKRLYQLVSEVVRGVEGHELVVLPGGVKKLARTVFKSAVNYGCNLSRITDQVRCTVVASTLAGVAAALQGLIECEAVSVVRVKNRFASDYDASPTGGYLDLQTMVLFEREGGGQVMGEVQINLWSMLRIKENPEGGHKIFNFARALRAYDEAMFMHEGEFNDSVAARIAAGVLLAVELKEKEKWESLYAVAALGRALASGECRVRELYMRNNAIGDTMSTALADALESNTSVSTLNLSNNTIGDSGAAALADCLKHNTSVSDLELGNNRIGDSGVAALADALRCNTFVRSLSLRENRIGDSGAAALADALEHNTSVCELDLRYNEIGDTGVAALARLPLRVQAILHG